MKNRFLNLLQVSLVFNWLDDELKERLENAKDKVKQLEILEKMALRGMNLNTDVIEKKEDGGVVKKSIGKTKKIKKRKKRLRTKKSGMKLA